MEMIKLRDEEIERLEGEIAGYRDDIDNMFTSFQQREQELRQEMAGAENRSQVNGPHASSFFSYKLKIYHLTSTIGLSST